MQDERSEPATPRSGRDRLLAIRRRWQWARATPMQFSWSRKRGFGTAFLGLGALFTVLVNYIDSSLHNVKSSPFFWHFTLPISGLGLSLLTAPLYLLSCGLLHRWLTRKTPEDFTARPWLLALRWLVLGLPMVGLGIIPVWQHLLETKPAWAFSARPVPQMLMPGTKAARPEWNLLDKLKPKLITLVAIQLIPLVLLTVWIERSKGLPAHRTSWPLATAISAAMHLILVASFSLFCWTLYQDRRISARKTFTLCGVSLLLLLPGPYWTSAAAVALILGSGITRDAVFLGSFMAQGVRRSPLWLDLEQRLEQTERPSHWRLPARDVREEDGPAGRKPFRRIRLLLSLKTALLLLDAATLSFLVETFARSMPMVALPTAALLAILALLSLLFIMVGLPYRTIQAVLRLARAAEPTPRPGMNLPGSLVRVAALFLNGYALGRLFQTEDAHLFRSMVTSMLTVIYEFLLRVARMFGGESWNTKPFETAAIPGFVAGFLESVPPRTLCGFWLSASTVAGILFARTLLPWFLRPFRAGDILCSELSPALRLAIALITLTSVLPLGGLAIPLWIFLHRRLWADGSPLNIVPGSGV